MLEKPHHLPLSACLWCSVNKAILSGETIFVFIEKLLMPVTNIFPFPSFYTFSSPLFSVGIWSCRF